MSELANETCESCRTAGGQLGAEAILGLLGRLDSNWRVINEHHLERHFQFKDFRQALAFTNRVGELAESQGHHPDFQLGWGKVTITIWTHSVNGLTRADFVLAAKIDQVS
jgi:4a-hydroxytetrahydrobiopterin dehydratase